MFSHLQPKLEEDLLADDDNDDHEDCERIYEKIAEGPPSPGSSTESTTGIEAPLLYQRKLLSLKIGGSHVCGMYKIRQAEGPPSPIVNSTFLIFKRNVQYGGSVMGVSSIITLAYNYI